MKVIVDNQEEAIEVSRALTVACNTLYSTIMDEIQQKSIEIILCRIRDSVVIKEE